MTKLNIKLLLLLTLPLLMACSSKRTQSPVAFTWEMGDNSLGRSAFDNTICLINTSGTDLDNDWEIFFNQKPIKVTKVDNPQINIESISGTFFKMTPTAEYKTLAAGDTLVIPFQCTSSVLKRASGPEGAYIILNKDASNPLDITIDKHLYNDPKQWTRQVADPPYPSGEFLYNKNSVWDQTLRAGMFDIIPTPKRIDEYKGISQISNQIAIKATDNLSTEAALLRSDLERLYGCQISESPATTITLALGVIEGVNSDEGYTLHVNSNNIEITGTTAHGVFNGIQTLISAFGAKQLPITMPDVLITDYPDFSHRGLMLDVARNFTTKANLFKIIDLLAMYKMDVLHIHLTDDEGWRLEIEGLEELTEVGARRGHTTDEQECLYPAYGSGWKVDNEDALGTGYYTKASFIEILHYAKANHIRVVPEIDMPGHARAAIVAMNARYNKYIATDKAKAEQYLLADLSDTSKYVSAQVYTDNTICVALPSVYTFVEKVVTEVENIYKEAGLKLDVLHMGGDEVPRGAWAGSPISIDFMKANDMTEIRDLKDYFFARTLGILNDKGIQLAAWQEIVLLPNKSANPRFATSNTLSYCWSTAPESKSDQVPYKLANAGYPIILSSLNNFYFDLSYDKHPEEPGAYWAGFIDEHKSFNMLPYDIYYSPRTDLWGNERDILKNAAGKEVLKASARKQIKGVQGQLWAETIRSFDMVEYSLLPKMFGLVERGWNASPEWESKPMSDLYKADIQLYQAKIVRRELPRVNARGHNFRIAQPGIRLEQGKLLMNSVFPDGEIRYTTDGSEPTATSTRWTEPVACDSQVVKAKVFYLGKESVTVDMR